MNFDGDFAGPQVISNLLVEHARDHERHDFSFAGRQRLIVLSQISDLILLLTRHPVTVQRLVDRVQQILVPKRFGQELHRAEFHGLHGHRDISVTSNKDDGDTNPSVGQLALKIETASSRQPDIQNQTTWTVNTLVAQELLWRTKSLGAQANRLQHALNRLPD